MDWSLLMHYQYEILYYIGSSITTHIVWWSFCSADRTKSLLNKRISHLEEACRAKEAERVDLELRLTQVKENLKKSLAGGTMGAQVEAKPPVKVQYVARRVYLRSCVRVSVFSLASLLWLFRCLAKRSRISTVSLYQWTVPQKCVGDHLPFVLLPQVLSYRRLK